MSIVLVVALLTFLADRFSKIYVLKLVFGLSQPVADKFGETLPLIDGIFHFTFAGNTGMAFSMLEGNKPLIIGLCVIILAMICVFWFKYKPQNPVVRISIGMIVGGAIGNVLDRFLYGFVIDFLDFRLIDYPIFNVADCFIVVGAILLCIYVIFFDKKEEEVGSKQIRCR